MIFRVVRECGAVDLNFSDFYGRLFPPIPKSPIKELL
jgi:hypothetical protein